VGEVAWNEICDVGERIYDLGFNNQEILVPMAEMVDR